MTWQNIIATKLYYDYNRKHRVVLRWQVVRFFLPNVLVEVSKVVGEKEEAGWQPISAISLQQSFQLWQLWSQ